MTYSYAAARRIVCAVMSALALIYLLAHGSVASASAATIQITATTSDGTNTGTARLGLTATMTATVSGSTQTAVTWAIQGAGSITQSGVYTAPNVMPSNSSVVVTATLASDSTVSSSYQLSLINPVPRVNSNGASPSQLLTGATQTVNILGTGLLPTTIVVVNGSTVASTYQDINHMSAQITVSSTAKGTISFQVQNPAPGGGHGTVVQETIVPNSISLTAVDQDGTNTGTAELGINVALTANVTGSAQTGVNWSVQGAGAINGSGIYSAPAVMPSSGAVIITASLASNPAITASYQLTLINPSPVVSAASVAQLPPGQTTTVTLSGSNFVPGTVVLANGSPTATTYQAPTSVVAQVPVAANASGSIALQAQNPAPGGGSSAALQVPVAVSMSLTASDTDGTNTGTAELGVNVTMTANVSGSSQNSVTWTVQGAGSIGSSGVYTAPTSMPSNASVVITATLVSSPAVTASYQLSLINPIPTVAGSSPSQLPAGATTAVTLSGNGFVSGTTILVNNSPVTATYQSPTSMSAQVPVSASASGTIALQAQNPSPGGGLSASLQLPIAVSISLTATDPDGTNTGTAQLGIDVLVSAAVSGSSQNAVNWSVQGAGSISSTGDYTPPQVMPANPSVTIIATLASNSAVTASYTLSLLNPVPRISANGASPAQLNAGSTQTLALLGSGFVQNTVVVVNGATVASTYVDYNHLTAQIPVASNAASPLSIQVQNPAPGGGHGTVIQEPVVSGSITLTATDADGTNTGTAELGVSVTMTATVPGTTQTAVTWSVQGAGSIGASGVYSAPLVMPSNSSVTITATLTSNPSVTASYQLTLINPVPALGSTTPSQVLVGGTTTLTIIGTQFVPGVVVLANGTAVSTTYLSPTSLSASVTVPAGATGSVSLQAQNPSPNGGASTAIQVSIQKATLSISATDVDGTNTGTDPIGYTVTFTPTITGTTNTSLTWSVTGAGSITQSGAYYPPSTMPSNPVVTVVATSNAYHTVTGSYQFSITNPVPGAIQSISPSKLMPGATNTVTVTGSHFTAGVTVWANGAPVTTTYQNSTTAQFSVALPGNASGSVPLAVQNVSPGGGTTPTYQAPITVESITLAASTSDGTNTGYDRLGQGINIRATVNAPGDPTLTWTMQGAGSITTAGYGSTQSGCYYTIGQTMPSSASVTVIATLKSNPAITATYSFAIVNAIPTLTSVSPSQLKSDQAQQIAIAGTGFSPTSAVYFNGVPVPTSYLSYGHLTAQVSLDDATIGPIPVQVVNAAPGGGSSAVIQQPIALKTVQVGAYTGSITNPTTVVLGTSIQFLDQITSGPGDPTATWSVQGGGSITSSGLYQAPASMPSSSSVTVVASLVTNPAAQGTYTLTLLYPTPFITETTPTQLSAGATTNLTLEGTGFTSDTTLWINGSQVSLTYQSATLLSTQIITTSGQTGSLSIVAKNPTTGGGGGSGNTFTLRIGNAATASAQISVQPGQLIAPNFLGFSHEWNGLQWMLGSSETEPNLAYRQLIKNLMKGTTYPFFIRIGGNSTDTTTTVQDMTAQKELAVALGAQFSYGLNLGGSTDPGIATAQAQAYAGAMPTNSIVAFELGNEPDNYVAEGYRTGTYASSWNITAYLNDIATWSCSIFNVAPSINFMGPSWASTTMLKTQSTLDVQEAPSAEPQPPAGCTNDFNPVTIVSQHLYGGYQDNGQTFASDYLLTPAAITGPATVASSVTAAHQNGQLFRIGEINSIDVGGVAEISDSFSSALWATDVMFEYANVGVDGVNWHGNVNCNYCAFNFTIANVDSQNIYTVQKISPIYYGMLLFQQAATNGAQLLPVSVQTNANLKVWATEDQTGTVHVVIINKDETFSGNVSISLPGYGPAQETDLVAPGYQANSGVTFGGQTFDGSIDGTLQGTPDVETVNPSNGAYVVPVQPVSAVLLTLSQQ